MKIIFCLPGSNFSGRFLDCWNDLIFYCMKNQIHMGISRHSGSNIHHLRAKCLGADVLRGKNQKIFNGMDYDYIMWIDSDTIFRPQHFQALLDHNMDMVGGLYAMEGGKQFAAVKKESWSHSKFLKQGYFDFMEYEKDIKNKTKLIEVAYCGFGFLLIKKGVIEKLEYPWFYPEMIQMDGSDVQDFTSEDTAFCRKVTKSGLKIYVDPKIVVGHEKKVIL